MVKPSRWLAAAGAGAVVLGLALLKVAAWLLSVVGHNPAKTRYFRASVLVRKLRDDDAAFSIGIVRSDAWINSNIRRGMAIEITQDAWNHAGCQSSCIRRGGKECRW